MLPSTIVGRTTKSKSHLTAFIYPLIWSYTHPKEAIKRFRYILSQYGHRQWYTQIAVPMSSCYVLCVISGYYTLIDCFTALCVEIALQMLKKMYRLHQRVTCFYFRINKNWLSPHVTILSKYIITICQSVHVSIHVPILQTICNAI